MVKVHGLLALLAGSLLTLVSCGGGVEKPLSPGSDFLFIKSDSVGSYGAAASAWSRIIRTHTCFLAVNSTTPTTENEKISQLVAGKIQIAFLKGPEAWLAYNGDPMYWKEPQPIRALFSMWPAVYSLIAHEESGIRSIPDIRGKRIALYSDRSVTGDLLEYLLSLYGIDEGNTDIVRVRETIGVKMLQQREVDCAWYDLGYGDYRLNKLFVTDPAYDELTITTENYGLVPCPPSEELEEFLKVYPLFFIRDYGGEFGLNDVPQLMTACFAAASPALPNELASQLTSLWWENLGLVRQYVPDDLIRLADTRDNRTGVPVPFHHGALSWLKAAGMAGAPR